MRAWKLLPVLVILSSAAPASAQVSIWLQRGVSGFGANVGVAASDNTTTLFTGGGYSYQGWADADVTLKYITFDDPPGFELELSEVALAPTIQIHPLKQSKTMPISIGLSAGIEIGWIDSPNFLEGASGRAFGYGFTANVYRFFKLSDHIGIIPAAGVGIGHSSVTFEDPDGIENTVDGSTVGVNTAAYLGYIDGGGRIWGLVPSLSFYHPFGDDAGDDFVEFGISFGLIFSQQPKEE